MASVHHTATANNTKRKERELITHIAFHNCHIIFTWSHIFCTCSSGNASGKYLGSYLNNSRTLKLLFNGPFKASYSDADRFT